MTNEKLDLLRRRNAGVQLRKEWDARLAAHLGPDRAALEFVDLDESDRFRARMMAAFPARTDGSVRTRGFIEGQIELQRAYLTETEIVPATEVAVLVFLRASDRTGALRCSANTFNRIWKELLRLENDGFVAADEELSGKIVVQVLTEGGTEVLDAAAWGVAWVVTLAGFIGHRDS